MTQVDDPTFALNDAQRRAVKTTEGPLLVLAGPGSGKTAVITHRIAHLIRSGVPSHQILALTFTNKAADEMKLRVQRLVSEHRAWVSTFHKFCARLLRIHGRFIGIDENFSIYDASDSRAALKEAVQSAQLEDMRISNEEVVSEIARAKHAAIDYEMYATNARSPLQVITAKVYQSYTRILRRANAVDFDDLLLLVVSLLRDNPELRATLDERYRYVMVDEYQDTNVAQFAIVRALSMDHPNLCATGDPDQSIYGWRGANLDNVLQFERCFASASVVRLEQNYRSTKSILRVADQLIHNNVRRLAKTLTTLNDEGQAVRLVAYPNPQHEASDIVEAIAASIRLKNRIPKDFAILYRANWLSRSFEHELRLHQIPYRVVHGHEFYQRKEIKDIFAYLSLLNNSADQVAFQRIVNVPPRKIGPATVAKLKRFADDQGVSLFESARRCGLDPGISKQAAAKVARFVALMDSLGEVRSHPSVQTIIERVLQVTKYQDYLLAEGGEEGHDRAANVDELVSAAAEFDQLHPEDGGLEAFLEASSLVNDADDLDSEGNAVSLLTLHAAKGLEFPCVFIVGLEDGLLPHERNRDSEALLEEERRLLFVGITRAEHELQLSRTLSRFRRGQNWNTIASRFLMELPRQEMEIAGPTSFEFFGSDADDPIEDLLDGNNEDWKPAPDRAKPEPPASSRKLVTAAQFLEQSANPPSKPETSRVPVESFQAGMVVEHPEYGFGIVKKLTGKSDKCVATVCFGDKERRFRLAHAPLRPSNKSP